MPPIYCLHRTDSETLNKIIPPFYPCQAPYLILLSSVSVPPPNRAYLRTLIHNAVLEHLEKVVLDGHGHVGIIHLPIDNN